MMQSKKKAGRKNCSQVDHNTGKRSIDVIGELCGDSAKQVQRYIKITELIPALLDKVDDGTMGFTPAVQLSYLKKKEQQEIMNAIDSTQCTPSLSQAIRMKKLSESGKLTEAEIEGILGEVKQKKTDRAVSYTHLRAHETRHDLVCRLLLEKKKRKRKKRERWGVMKDGRK